MYIAHRALQSSARAHGYCATRLRAIARRVAVSLRCLPGRASCAGRPRARPLAGREAGANPSSTRAPPRLHVSSVLLSRPIPCQPGGPGGATLSRPSPHTYSPVSSAAGRNARSPDATSASSRGESGAMRWVTTTRSTSAAALATAAKESSKASAARLKERCTAELFTPPLSTAPSHSPTGLRRHPAVSGAVDAPSGQWTAARRGACAVAGSAARGRRRGQGRA